MTALLVTLSALASPAEPTALELAVWNANADALVAARVDTQDLGLLAVGLAGVSTRDAREKLAILARSGPSEVAVPAMWGLARQPDGLAALWSWAADPAWWEQASEPVRVAWLRSLARAASQPREMSHHGAPPDARSAESEPAAVPVQAVVQRLVAEMTHDGPLGMAALHGLAELAASGVAVPDVAWSVWAARWGAGVGPGMPSGRWMAAASHLLHAARHQVWPASVWAVVNRRSARVGDRTQTAWVMAARDAQAERRAAGTPEPASAVVGEPSVVLSPAVVDVAALQAACPKAPQSVVLQLAAGPVVIDLDHQQAPVSACAFAAHMAVLAPEELLLVSASGTGIVAAQGTSGWAVLHRPMRLDGVPMGEGRVAWQPSLGPNGWGVALRADPLRDGDGTAVGTVVRGLHRLHALQEPAAVLSAAVTWVPW